MANTGDAVAQAPVWVPALISAGVALLISGLSMMGAMRRLRTELKLEFATEAALRDLLSDKRYKMRSFPQLKKRLKGLEDDELRKALIRAGAVSFRKRGAGDNDEASELWGLRERNVKDLWEKPNEA